MKFKVVLTDVVEYEVEAASRDEAIKSAIYSPLYDTSESIKKVNEKSTCVCEEVD
ncbi:hypothetical protein [Enterococcus sp. AZ109]|uniref:hypothetical protein n=1 Tax=Enterococcus sp. AZ109 TaxID=2774634 RepID=UPI003F683662